MAAQPDRITVSADPGTFVHWSEPATKRMNDRSWPVLQETCYYPVDLLHKPGRIKITRWWYESRESADISVEPFPYETREVDAAPCLESGLPVLEGVVLLLFVGTIS
jgi:hypothetical protein